MTHPSEYPSRILLAVTGMSPQILTETLWALAVAEDPPFIPTEIRLLTTSLGKQRAQFALLSEDPGWLRRLSRDYALPPIQFDASAIEVIQDAHGNPMEDIRTPEDNEAAATFLTERVRQLTSNEEVALHVSLAGGRKTMGYYLGYALSLYGRPQDRLSHILVSAPFESSWDFFYPTPYERIIEVGPQKALANCQDAQIDLAHIPFVRLRDELPTRFRKYHNFFTDIVAAANCSLEPPLLRLESWNQAVQADDQPIPLSKTEFAILYWLAKETRSTEEWNWLLAGQRLLHVSQRVLPEISGAHGSMKESIEARLKNVDLLIEYVAPHVSRINKKFSDVLGIVAAKRYQIESHSIPRGDRYFLLPLPPESFQE